MWASDYFGFGGYGGGWDGGVDRSGWRDKSDAAIRREDDAKRRFDGFLERAKEATAFPMTEDVVPPSVHLTGPCWKTFKQYVNGHGCSTKRREATREERIASRETRKGKVYVISVTCPVCPKQLMEQKAKAAAEAKERKEKAAAAAEKKRVEQQRKAEEARQLQVKAKEEYEAVVASMDTECGDADKKKRVLADHNVKDEETAASPTKKVKLSVPTASILQHAEQVHQKRLIEIANKMSTEKYTEREKLLRELNERMSAKEQALKKEAREQCDEIKSTIEEIAAKSQ